MEERLNKWLSQMGVCSRREADRLIEAGKVLVDNRPASMGQKVTPGQWYAMEKWSGWTGANGPDRCFWQ